MTLRPLVNRIVALEAHVLKWDKERMKQAFGKCYFGSLDPDEEPPTEEDYRLATELYETDSATREYVARFELVYGPIAERMQAASEAGRAALTTVVGEDN